jgi:hypothetical protein
METSISSKLYSLVVSRGIVDDASAIIAEARKIIARAPRSYGALSTRLVLLYLLELDAHVNRISADAKIALEILTRSKCFDRMFELEKKDRPFGSCFSS